MTDYASIKAVNWSTLKWMAVSPKHYRWHLEHPEPRKPAYVFGGAVHCLLFEPDKFDSRYAGYDGIRRGWQWDEWQAQHPGIESLKPNELDEVQAVVKSIREHPRAAALLDGCRVEEPIQWTDQATGLAMKGRIDAIKPQYLLDLKTGRDVIPGRFLRASASYLVHGQLALYQDGALRLGKIQDDTPPYVISVEKSPPYDVVIYQLTHDALVLGRAVYRSLLNKLMQCQAADWWPGISPDVVPYTIPAYLEGPTNTDEGEDF